MHKQMGRKRNKRDREEMLGKIIEAFAKDMSEIRLYIKENRKALNENISRHIHTE